jgi:hypothetical protein
MEKKMVDISEILNERKSSHGEYKDHARRAQLIKEVYRAGRNWPILTDIQKETLEMNAHKVARILEGNPNHADHWDDIAGYAKLVSDRLVISDRVEPLGVEPNRPGTPEDGGHHEKEMLPPEPYGVGMRDQYSHNVDAGTFPSTLLTNRG